MYTIKLNNGMEMPQLGLGTWKSAPESAASAVEYALAEAGYSHIDCAAIYQNEQEIGRVLNKVFTSGQRQRGDIFITSKVWNTDHRAEHVRKACEKTLDDLQLDYLDLYLVHWGIAVAGENKTVLNSIGRPGEQLDENGVLITEKVSIRETWEAMEQLVEAGLVKAIGVSNFTAPMLLDLLSYAKVIPAVNQIELHVYLQQPELVEFCQSKGITVTAYSPLASPGNFRDKGFPVLLEDEAVKAIAVKHSKTPAQVALRWGLQRGTVVIPKSITPQLINQNLDVFDFELDQADMTAIAALDRKLRFVNPYVWWKIPYFN